MTIGDVGGPAQDAVWRAASSTIRAAVYSANAVPAIVDRVICEPVHSAIARTVLNTIPKGHNNEVDNRRD